VVGGRWCPRCRRAAQPRRGVAGASARRVGARLRRGSRPAGRLDAGRCWGDGGARRHGRETAFPPCSHLAPTGFTDSRRCQYSRPDLVISSGARNATQNITVHDMPTPTPSGAGCWPCLGSAQRPARHSSTAIAGHLLPSACKLTHRSNVGSADVPAPRAPVYTFLAINVDYVVAWLSSTDLFRAGDPGWCRSCRPGCGVSRRCRVVAIDYSRSGRRNGSVGGGAFVRPRSSLDCNDL